MIKPKITRIRAVLQMGEDTVIINCGAISPCPIKSDHFVFGDCEDFSIEDEDGEFIVDSFSFKQSALLQYSIGYYDQVEQEASEVIENKEDASLESEEPLEEAPEAEEDSSDNLESEPEGIDIGRLIDG